ncbi:MAG: hypothetical protein JW780_05175 [Clostridiales bacterium]|nr:hypothetical protein [Clostridiales bacterium]
MKRLLLSVLAIFIILALFGCRKPDSLISEKETTKEDTNIGVETENEDQRSESNEETEHDPRDDEKNDAIDSEGMSEDDFEAIDWNTDAYSQYFKVVSGQAVIHYWDGGETALIQAPDVLIYVSGGNSLALDLETGEISEGYGGAFIPPAANLTEEGRKPKYSDFLGVDVFEDADMYVFRYDVEGGTASYYVNNSLVCVGWVYSSSEGEAAIIINDTRSFEEVVDEIFREYADGSSSGSNNKYADSDGDGYSDWNEDRKPSDEEFDYLTDLWKSEGLTGEEYFDKIDELDLLGP